MDISRIKELCKARGFRPDKRLGQNFLVDNNVREKIISVLPVDSGTVILEIGPGLGMMTGRLADIGKQVFAVEKDTDLFLTAREMFAEKKNVKLLGEDILKTDIGAIAESSGGKLFLYGNIPYNITAPIIEKAIRSKEVISHLYMVIQEEVAARLCAPPGSRTYGALSCFAGYHADIKRFFKISKNCFFPRPRVDSCLVGLSFYDAPEVKVKDEKLMFDIIRQSFSQRRKKILNPLSSRNFLGMGREEWKDVFFSAGVDPCSRAEDLSLEDYAGLSDAAGERPRSV